MFLKSLTLKGFLCYKDTTTVDFHPGFNVIVGPNGSGKSSLLAGIRFVLGGDEGERRTFLHQGKSARALTGYVTAVLDNSDGRASGIDGSELVIRREFGVKRDDLSLNGKRVSRKDLNNVLESAGFPRSNPFYLVYQHEVTALARVTPEERYAVLKDVAGTQIYEERRKEALANLEKSASRRQEIDTSLQMIRQRVSELQAEQQRLTEYTELDKEQKCLECLVARRKLEALQQQLDQLATSRASLEEKISSANGHYTDLQQTLEQAQEEMEQARNAAGRATEELKDRRTDHSQRAAEAARLQLEYEDAHRKTLAAEQQRQRAVQRKEELEAKRLEITRETEQLDKDVQVASELARKAAANLRSARAAAAALENASGASSVAGRKKSLVATAKQSETEAKALKTRVAHYSKKTQTLQTQWEEAKQQLQKLREMRNALAAGMPSNGAVDYGAQLDQLKAEERETRQKMAQAQDKIDRADHAARRAEGDMMRTVRPSTVAANRCILEWAAESGALHRGEVLGPLIDLISVEEKYWVAVERAAGAELFNVLVADASIARQAVQVVKSRRAGGTTITPLKETDKLLPRSRAPTGVNGVRPLTSVVQCCGSVNIAVRQVFGRFLLVDSLELGREWSARGFDCITLEGDQVSRKGILSGGWQGQVVRLRLSSEMRMRQQDRANAEASFKLLQDQQEDLEKRIHDLEAHRREHEAAHLGKRREYEDAVERVATLTSRVETLKREVSQSEGELADAEQQLQLVQSAVQAIRREILTCEEDGTENAPEGRMQSLAQQLPVLAAEAQKLGDELGFLQRRKADAEAQLEQLAQESEALDAPVVLPPNPEELLQECRRHQQAVATVEAEVATLQSQLKKHKSALTAAEKTAQETTRNCQHVRTKINKWKAEIESLESRAASISAQRSSIEAASNEVAGMHEALNRLAELPSTELAKRQIDVARRIEKLGWVNTKAADDLREVASDVAGLESQKEELFASEASVYQLMETFDQQKAETLLKTFENVNKNFSEIFARIVKGGEAHLVLKRLAPEELLQQQQALAASQGSANPHQQRQVDPYVGVGIKVRFPGSQALTPLESLSGGQKSVAALSIIFALQHVDSAPLFVLDEVDAALDTSYRSAVAGVVKTQAENHQMIVISHRSQIISAADYFLRTAVVNQESLVIATNLEEALMVSQRQATVDEGQSQRAIAAA